MCSNVPTVQGVYMIVNPFGIAPVFLNVNIGGHFKGNDPTVTIDRLQEKWVEDTKVLYIGKAGHPGGRQNLRTRIRSYMRFGLGNPAAHWGGRYIWQIAHSGSLQICWKPIPDENPRDVESDLLHKFEGQYGCLPFANLHH